MGLYPPYWTPLVFWTVVSGGVYSPFCVAEGTRLTTSACPGC